MVILHCSNIKCGLSMDRRGGIDKRCRAVSSVLHQPVRDDQLSNLMKLLQIHNGYNYSTVDFLNSGAKLPV